MIGELVMDKLKSVDEVAYVRFASVYREFKDVSTFMEELGKLFEKVKVRKELPQKNTESRILYVSMFLPRQNGRFLICDSL